MLGVTLVVTFAAWTGGRLGGAEPETRPALRAPVAGANVPAAGAAPEQRTDVLRRHLREQPRDAAAWAALGSWQVEQARRTADPLLYGRAERAFARSLAVRPATARDAAYAGQASLAAARHHFGAALTLARRSLAANPYGELALAVRVDALVELGRYDAAYRAALQADARRPGVPAFTRLAHVHELRGDRAAARRVLRQALANASDPADTAYVATALGDLARSGGQARAAARDYATALRAVPRHPAALLGRGQLRAATGDLRGGIRDLRSVVARQPLPEPLALLGEMYAASGSPAAARRQFALVGTWARLARAQRVDTDLDMALVNADHGDPADALRAARAAWQRRHTVHTADALGWALYRAGDPRAALPLARFATGKGYRNAMFLHHRATIERALRLDGPAARHAARAHHLRIALTPAARSAR